MDAVIIEKQGSIKGGEVVGQPLFFEKLIEV